MRKRPFMPVFKVFLWLFSFGMAFGLIRSVVGHLLRIDVVSEHQRTYVVEQEKNRKLNKTLKEATSSAFIEKQAREKLGLVKTGDIIVLLQRKDGPLDGEHMAKAGQVAIWEQWWHLFY